MQLPRPDPELSRRRHYRDFSFDCSSKAVTILQREGRLSPLGEAIASYGRIFKTLHILAAVTEESYRRDMGSEEQRNGEWR